MADNQTSIINNETPHSILNDMIRRQACQIEIMKTKNEELTMLVGYLKDLLIELDPCINSQLGYLNIQCIPRYLPELLWNTTQAKE